MRTVPRLRVIGAVLAIAALLLLVFSAPAHAVEGTFVSNNGRSSDAAFNISSNQYAQGFTTGDNSGGYVLTSVEVNLAAGAGSGTLTATVRSSSSNNPGTTLCTLNTPNNLGSGVRKFSAPATCANLTGNTLSASTNYFVVMTSGGGGTATWRATASDAEDDSGATDWVIRDDRLVLVNNQWGSDTGTTYAYKIKINAENTAPTGADSEVATHENENYAFEGGDFNFQDADDHRLDHVKITSLPGTGGGTLSLNGADITSAPQEVTAAQLDDGDLKYNPPTDASSDVFTTFQFKVSDGYEDSASTYTFTLKNDGPTIIGPDEISWPENKPANHEVGSYPITAPGNFGLTFAVSGDDADDFDVLETTQAGGGKALSVTFDSSPDAEDPDDADTDNVYELTLEVTANSLTDTLDVTVTVTDVNEFDPTVTGLATVDYAENGTDAIATYTIADADVSDTVSVSALTGDDASQFSRTTTDNNDGTVTAELNFIAAPDFEAPTDSGGDNDYEVTLSGSDGSNTTDLDITVTVTGVNDNNPTLTGPTTLTVAENTPTTTVIATYMATDADGDVITFELGGGSGSGADRFDFIIDGNTGVLTFANPPDFETPADLDTNNVYEMIMRALDGSPVDPDTNYSLALNVTVTVTDLPAVSGLTAVQYAENGTAAVDTYTATDADGQAVSVTWSLEGDDSGDFTISAGGALSFASSPDHESATDDNTDNEYNVTVVATDGSEPGRLNVTVDVTNVNEAPTFNEGTSTTRNIDENSAAGTNVGSRVIATDPDTSEPLYSSLTYYLGGTGTDKDAFTINSNDGQLSVASGVTIDYETKSSYSVTVSVRDSKDASGTADTAIDATIAVTINVRGVTVSETSVTVAEDENAAEHTATYTVKLGTEPTGDVTVTPASGDTTAATVSPTTLTFTTTNWSTTQTVTVTGVDDAIDNDGRTATISHTVAGADYGSVTAPDVSVTLTDDDATPAVDLSVSPTSVAEGDGATTVTVTATLNPTTVTFPADTAVTVSVTDSAASGVVGFTAVSDITVTIASGATSGTGTFTLTPEDDAVDEADETITVSGSSGTLTVNGTTLALTDDDATPAVDLSVSPTSVAEGDGATTVTVTATLNPTTVTFPADTAVTVSVTDSNTSGVVGFTAVSDITVTIASGATSGTGTFTLTPEDDAVDEADETVTVSGSSGTLTVNGTTLALTDDDATPAVDLSVSPTSVAEGDGATTVTVTATLNPTTVTFPADTAVTVSVTDSAASGVVGFTAVSDITVTIASGATSGTGTFTLTPEDDAVDEADETVTVSGSSGTLTVNGTTLALTDDDATPAVDLSVSPTSVAEGDGATTVTVTATLNPTTVTFPADTAVTVSVTDSNTSGVVGFTAVSDITVTIASGATSGTGTFTLTPADDAVDEADETVTVSGSSGTLTVNETTLALTDDDATPAVDLSVSPTSVDEGDGATTVTVTATLNPTTVTFPADTAVTVSVTDSNTSGVVGFTAVSDITVTIASGATSGTGRFTLTPEDDAVDEADETVTVSGSSGTLMVNATTLALTDDDATPAVDLSVSPTSVAEGDGATTVTVTATLNPTTVTFPADTAVTVSVTDSNTSGVVGFTAVSDITVTIASGATSGTGTFTLTPADDAVDEADETVTVSGSSGTLMVNETTLALTDDDATPAVDLSVSPTSVDEGDGATTVTVTATLNPTTVTFPADTAVTVSVTDSNTSGVVGFTAVSDITVTIASGATSGTGRFTLTPEDDAVDEADETVTVSGSSGTLMVNATTLALTDDDATPAVDLSVSPTSVAEGDGATTVTVTATLNPTTVTFPAATAVTVSVAGTLGDTAVGFATVSDFTITIPAATATATGTFTLTPTNDAVDEIDEVIDVTGESGSLTITKASIDLTDDDDAPTGITLTLTDASNVALSTVAENVATAPTITVTAAVNGSTTYASATAVTVSVAGTLGDTAVGFATVSDFTITIPAATATATGTFTLTPTNDAVDEIDEVIDVTGESGSLTITKASIDLTDDDDAPTGITLTLTDASNVALSTVAENVATAPTITVTAAVNGSTTYASATAVTVSVAGTLGDTAVGFATVSDFTITIPAATATATGTFTLTPTNDAVDEIDEVIDVTGESGSLTITKASIDLTDDDDAPTGITLTLTDASNVALSTVAENVATAPTITVTAAVNGSTTYASATAVTVSVAGTLGDTAVGFATVSDFTITIPAATATATGTFTLTPTNDAVDEIDEVIDVTGESGSLTITKASIDLTDDDDAPTGITLTLTDASNVALSTVAENVATAPTITVTAAVNGSTTYASATAVTVSVAGTLGDTAVGFATVSDFTITIPAATATATGTFTLTPTNDAVDEIDEVIDVTGESGSLTITKASIDLTDDDDAPTGITLTLTDASNVALSTVAENVATAPTITVTAAVNGSTTYASATAVTVSVAGTLGDTAVGFATVSDFTITIPAATATATGTFTLTPTNDAVDEIDEVIDVTGESGSLTITKASIDLTDDDDAPTGITLTLTDASNVALSTVAENVATAPTITVTAAVNGSTTYASATAVTVSVAGTLGDTAVGFATVSDFTITIPAATATATGTFTLTPTNDAVDEIDEVIDVTGESGSLTITKASIDLTDDDDAPTGITLTLTDASNVALSTVAENVATAPTITVTAAVNGSTTYASATAVTVSVAGTLGDTAVGFATVSDFTITIPAATATATGTFTLTPTNDAVDEIDEVIDVTGESGSLTITKASIDLTDDDDAPSGITLTLTDASNVALSTVAENVATAPTITVTAAVNGSTTYPSATAVTVSVAGTLGDTAVDFATVSDFTITIPAATATATGTFTLTPTNDAVDEIDEVIDVTGESGSLTITKASIDLTDDDDAPSGITLTLTDASNVALSTVAEEADATDVTVTATVNGTTTYAAEQTVTVAVGAEDDAAKEETDYALVADITIAIPAGGVSATGTFSLDPTGDVIDEGDGETLSVEGSAASGVSVTGAGVTITDNDVAPSAPVNFQATPGDAQVTLSWTDPGDATIDNYQVSSDGGTSFADIPGSGATTTSHIVTGLTNGTAYTLALRAVNGSGNGAVSSIAATPVAVPAAPLGLTAAAGDAQATLSWTDPGNDTITGYELRVDSGAWADIPGSDADTASHTVTGLTNGTAYSFALRAVNASGDGAVSSIAATPVAAVAGVPAAPVGLSATPGDAQVTLSWTDPGDATIDNYQVSSDGGTSFADIPGSGATTTSHIVTGLTNGTAYTLALRAVNGSGNGAVSSIAATPVAVPAAPLGLTAAAGDAQATLSWTDPGNDTITGYELRVDSGAWADIPGSDADTASHTVTGLTNGTAYSFALRAVNASGDGAVSSIAATPVAAVAGVPAAPVGLSATPGDAQVTLSWTDPGDATIDNYQVSSDGGTSFADIPGSGATTTSHIVTGLTNGTAYTLALRAVNGSGNGAVSSIAATPVAVPAAPLGLTAAAGDAQATLSWTDPGNDTITGYELRVDSGAWADIPGSDADTASHTVTGLTNGTAYSFALRAVNASGDGAVSSIAATPVAAVAGVPAAPVGLSATPGDAQVTLSWTDPGDATIDNYQVSSDGGTSFADIPGSGATTTSHIVTGLTNGTAYTLALRAVNGSGNGAVSSIAATPVAVPAAPLGLTAAAGDAQATLSWTDPGNDTITGYELRVDSGAWADIAGSDADTASHTVTGLTNGTAYSFALRAVNASGDGAVSSIAATPVAAVAGVPAAPVGLSATPGDAQVTLSWTDPGDATIDNYQVSSDGGTSFADIPGSGATTTSHIVTGLTNGTAYTLALRAVNGSGNGAVSSIAATPVAVPAAPLGLTAAAGDAQATLSWTDPGNDTITGYELRVDSGAWADIAGSDADTASHTVTGLTNGTAYSFALRAVNASGDGAVSSIAATPRAAVAGVPAAPVGLSATPGDAQVTLSWTDPGDATIDNYQVSSDGGTSFADIPGSGATTTSHIVTGLTNGTAYTLALRAVNGSGNGAVSSIAATPVAVPAAPLGLTAAAGDAQATLSWTDPGNDTITGYELRVDSGAWADIPGSDADTASHTVTGLTNGTAYSFALRAVNASGDGAVSSIAATPVAAVAGVPAAPVGLSATPGDAQVTLSWTDPGDATIDNYQVSSDGGTSFADIPGSGATTTSHIVTGLTNGTAYTLALRAVNGSGNGAVSSIAATPVAVPAAPLGLTAAAGDAQATLSWTDPGNDTITGYELRVDSGAWADIPGSDADTASHTVTGLTNGTAYSFALRAVNASGDGAVSSIAATPVAAVAGVPAAPVGLSATPGDAQVTLSWTDPGDATIDNYQVSSDGGTSFADIPGSGATTTSHIVTGLTNGTAYTLALRAVNGSGNGAVSSIAATPVAVPAAPLGLTAAAGDAQATLSWTDPGNDTITGYELRVDSGAWADIAGSDADTASHTVTGLTNGTAYSFALRAVNASGDGAVSSIAATPRAAVAGVPAAPVGLSATPGDAQVTLSWTDPGDATITNYQVSSDGGTSFADIPGSGATTTSHIVTGLTNGTAYTLALRAVNGSGNGAVSSIAATPVAVPAAPLGLTAAAGDAQATLSWTDPGNDTITGYELRVDSGAWADIPGSDADTASHTVTGLTNGTAYSFALRAVNASGDGAVSSIAATPVAAVAGVPAAPVGLSATPGDAQVTLSWTDPGDATIDNYQVSSDGGTSFADIPGSGATTTSHIVTGLTNGTAYTLALRAVNGSGNGAVSSIAATPVAVPAAPLGLTAAAGDAQATLSWTDPGNDTITGYELRVDSGAWADIAGSDADTASHTVTGLTNGTAYSFALRAVNASGDGAVSSIAATPVAAVAGVPAAPVGLSATPGDAQVTLSWTDPGDATIDNYQVSSDGGTSFADIPGSGATTTSHIVTGLTNGTAYTLALRAVNGSGNGAVSSIAATPVAVPAAPLGLTAAAGDAQATLSWTDPGNDTITGYELRVDSGAWADIPGSDADTASHTVTGLTNGTAYSFALRAVNASGDGAVSSIAATPVAAVAGVPAAPVGLSATPGDAQVTLSWTDPGDATIDNYQVSSDGGTSFADIPGSGATTTSHIVTGLTNGTAYTLALRAVNGSGNGAVSSIAATPVAVPAAPLGLTAAAGDAQATLSWTDPGNDTITGYELRVDSGAWADIPGSDADTASHTVTGLTNGTAYSFALRAVNASGDGAVSSIAATPVAAVAGVPAAPVGLSATPGDAQVTLSWTDPGDATIDNYQVSSDGGTSFADIPGSGATTTSHIVTGLTNGTAYTLALRAVNGSGNGAVSSIAATPVAVPAAPLGLTAAAGDAQATLSWTDPGNDTITGYELRVDSGAWADIPGSDADTASHTVTGLTNGTAYSFALRAVNASGDGAVSSIAATPVAAVAGVPAAPVGLSATPGDAQVTLSWTDPGDATIDNYQVSSDGGTSFADIPGSGATTTSHIVTGLTNGTAYTLALRAVNGSGNGAVSSIAATPVAVPAAPLGLTAAAGDAQATLSWTDPGNDTITGYELRVDSGAWADIPGSDADTASHTVTGLTNGTAYSFALRAVNASGDGAVSSIAATPVAAVAGVPAAPVGLSATPGDAQVTLSWTDPGDATIDNYQVSSDGGTSFADIPGSGATTTSHIVTGLTNGTAYTLALRAVNGSGNGAVSSIAATPVAVPAAPLGLTAAAGDAQATLSWTDPGNDTITGYELRVDSGAWADIPGSDADTASHTVTGLTNGTAYSFALRAVNASGDGAVSSIAATPRAAVAGVPAAPVGLSATPGDAQVTLSWTDPGDATITNYQVSSDGGTSFADIPGSGATTTSHIVTGLTNGTAYTLALRAVNGSGNGAVSSIAATPVAVPAAPLGLTAAAGDAQATLSWTDPGNDTITGYELRVDSGAWADIPGSDADTASHTVTGLTNGTAYSFALRAVNASGDGAVSSIAATPRAAVAGVPAAPVGLSATPGDAQVTLSWTDPGDATIDNYQVSSDGGTSFADIPGSGATTTSHIVTGLTNGTAYTLALRAVNGSGNGAVSSIAATPVAVPAAPLGLTAAAGDAQATLSWTDPGNDTITGYELRVDSGAWADIPGSDADTASHTVTGLTNGTAYSFALRAVNASGDGAVSSIAATPRAAVAGVPAAPVGLSATPGDAQVTLSWTDPGDATIDNYQVSSDGGTSFADIPGSGATTTSHIVTGLTNGTAYTLALRAVNGSGNGAVSSIAATPVAVPAAPLGLTAAAGDAQATLSWTDPGNDTITGYELRVDSGAWADIPGSDADTASHTVTGLTNGTAYSFALRAVNASGDGAVSSIAATPRAAVAGVPAAPVGLSATPGDAQVTLSWTDPGDATIDNYQVSSDGGTSFADIPGSGATTTSHIVTGLTNGTAYTLALRAVNGSGNGAVSSIAATPVAVPAAPLGLTAAAGDAQATLSWTDPGNDTITGYELRVDSGAWADIPGSDADTASHTVTGLTNGTAYSFALRAVNASGDGAVSSIAATPVAAVAGVPAAPVGLSATPGDAQVTLSWTDPGDATIDNYQVSSDGGTSFADIPGSGATTTSHIVTGLTNGTAYTLALRAVNGSGNGAVSSIAATPVAVPAAPLGLTAAAGDAQATLSWTDPGNDTITGYELRVDSGAWADIPGSDADTASHTVTGLTNGTAYSFALRAVNASGDGAVSSIAATPRAAVAGVPAAPVGLSATPGDAQVTLSWTDPGDATIDNYQVSSDGGTSFADIPGSGATTTSHIVTGLTNGTAYTLALRAVNGSGNGAVSSIAATPVAVPAAPLDFQATAGDARVTLTWNTADDDSILRWEYRQREGTGDYGAWTAIDGSHPGTTAHAVEPLVNGTAYTFRVRAVNATGNGASSGGQSATPTAGNNPPTVQNPLADLTLVAGATQDVDVSGTFDDHDDDALTYTASSDDTSVATVSLSGTTLTVSGVAAGATTVTVSASDSSASASDTFAVTVETDTQPGLAAIADQSYTRGGEIAALTLPSSSTGNGPLTYSLSPALPAGLSFDTTTRTLSGTPTGLQASTSYTYKVVDANEDEATQSFNITVLAPVAAAVAVSETALTVAEPAGLATYTVVLTSQPTGTVTVMPSSSDTLMARVSPTPLRFTTSNWSMTQTVTVTAVDDDLVNASDRSVSITHTAASTDTNYDLSSDNLGSVAVTVTDDDMASDSIVLSVEPKSVGEGDGATPVPVTAAFPEGSSRLSSRTIVTVQVTGNTASADDFVAVRDFTVTIEAMALSGTGTFTLTPISDVLMEGDETVTVSGTAAGGFTVTGTEVTIVDDVRGATQDRTAVNREVLPLVTQAMAASTATAVKERIDAVTSGVGQVPSYNLASHQTLAGVLQTVSDGLRDGSLTIERLLGGSSFVLPLHATNDGQQTGLRSLAIWGNGDYRNLGGGEAIDWDGEIFSGHLGVDTRLSANLLAGLAASWSKGSFDYAGLSGTNPVGGSYTNRMTSVHPYVNWSLPAGVDLWGSLGYGWGELAIAMQGEPQTEVSDTTMQTASVGANGKVLSMAGLLPGGTTILRLKGEALLTKIKVEGDGGAIEPLSLEARRFRLALEGLHEHEMASGGRLVPAVEIGVRHDGGDGLAGTGLELGGGLRYVDPTIGLTIDGRGRALVTYGEQEYREWGASLFIQLDPGAAGQGLSFNVMPAYGQTASGVTRLWDQGLDGVGTSPSEASARLEAVVGYGLPTLEGTGLVTPYSGVTLSSGGHRLRLGSTLAVGSSFNVSLEGTQAMRSEATSREATPVYGVRLQADWQF